VPAAKVVLVVIAIEVIADVLRHKGTERLTRPEPFWSLEDVVSKVLKVEPA
jgi:hypothetical protein